MITVVPNHLPSGEPDSCTECPCDRCSCGCHDTSVPVLGMFLALLLLLWLFANSMAFLDGTDDWGSLNIFSHQVSESCTKWPQTYADLLVPGYKAGCLAAEVLERPISKP